MSWRLDPKVRPSRYELYLNIDNDSQTVRGHVLISVRDTRADLNRNTVHLHCGSGVQLSRAIWFQTHADEQHFHIVQNDTRYDTVSLLCAKTLPKTYYLRLLFVTQLRNDAQGLFKCISHGNPVYATQFQPTFARHAFPCFDEPAFKAVFSIHVTFTHENTGLVWRILSNTSTKTTERVLNPLHTTTISVGFEDTPIMSTYLVAIVAAPLETLADAAVSSVENVAVRVWLHPDDMALPRKQKAALRVQKYAAACLDLMANTFIRGASVIKVDIVSIPDFLGDAMENWGLILFRGDSMLKTASHNSHPDLLPSMELVAHEIAHYWFGNLVTADWWSDLWWHESLASFIAVWIVEKLGCDTRRSHASDTWPDFVEQSLFVTFKEAMLPCTAPVRPNDSALRDVHDIQDLFGNVTYVKGSLIMRSMYLLMGEESFVRLLRGLLVTHAYGIVCLQDFIAALADPQSRRFFFHWMTTPSVPMISNQQPIVALNEPHAICGAWPLVQWNMITGRYCVSDEALPQGMRGSPCAVILWPDTPSSKDVFANILHIHSCFACIRAGIIPLKHAKRVFLEVVKRAHAAVSSKNSSFISTAAEVFPIQATEDATKSVIENPKAVDTITLHQTMNPKLSRARQWKEWLIIAQEAKSTDTLLDMLNVMPVVDFNRLLSSSSRVNKKLRMEFFQTCWSEYLKHVNKDTAVRFLSSSMITMPNKMFWEQFVRKNMIGFRGKTTVANALCQVSMLDDINRRLQVLKDMK